MLESSDNVITKGIAEKAKTYLDWLETVFLSDDRMKSLVQLFEHPKNENSGTKDEENKTEELVIEDRPINEKIK